MSGDTKSDSINQDKMIILNVYANENRIKISEAKIEKAEIIKTHILLSLLVKSLKAKMP